VLEDSSGRVVMRKDADAVVPVASLTKLMTAMVVLDAKLDPQEMLRISRGDVNSFRHSSSRVQAGAEMPRTTVLKLALMASDNRAATALARTYPGGVGAFQRAMRAKIDSLGLSHTVLDDPTGLSPSNTSTATEIAKITVAASRYSEIAQITSDPGERVLINGQPRDLRNTNRLVGGEGWNISLSKTGYSAAAGRCLAMRVTSGGKNFTLVVLDADGSAWQLRDAPRIHRQQAGQPV